MDIPILTSDVIARLVQADNAFTLSRVKHVQELQGNPVGVEYREFRHVLATLMTQHPENWWNRIGGIAAGDENLIDETLKWYRQFGLQPSFDIAPPQASPELLRALAEHGFFQSGFRNVYYGTPVAEQSQSVPLVVVEQVPNDSIIFFDLGRKNHFIPDGDFYLWRDVTRAQFADSRCYVAYVEDEPAAQAAMFVRDGVASFGFTGTLEQYRGRGCHTALLRTRLRDAARSASHCDLVTVQANPGSASARNIERAGLRVAYTKAIWSKF